VYEVFLLFLIPIGGGIPAGVILASNKGISRPIMILLYASADVVLARIFEPVMLLIARLAHAVRKEAVLLANGS
jgi:hypothetical protein